MPKFPPNNFFSFLRHHYGFTNYFDILNFLFSNSIHLYCDFSIGNTEQQKHDVKRNFLNLIAGNKVKQYKTFIKNSINKRELIKAF